MSKEDIDITHSKINMASYGFGNFFNEFFTLAFGSLVFFFYETEIGYTKSHNSRIKGYSEK